MYNRALIIAATMLLAAVSFRVGTEIVSAQDAVALHGAVTSQAEGQMEGVVVSARKDGAIFTVSVISDSEGQYSFPRTHLEPGQYTLTTRAVGFELEGPMAAEVSAGSAATVDLDLAETDNLAAQLSSAEWMMSVSGTQEQKERFAYQIMSCNYCHTLGRVFTSRHTSETLMRAMQRMVEYYADGTAVSNDNRRGRAARVQEPGREMMEETPDWGAFPWVPRTEIAEFVASNNLSAGRAAHQFELKTLPRVSGKGTRVIITEYDMPTAGTVAHDMDIDSKGIVWYTDESGQILGRFDPKTATFREIAMPPVPEGEMEGTRDVVVDHNDKVWFPLRVPGNHAVMARFDPETEEVELIGDIGGQFVALGGDGFVWAGSNRINPDTLEVEGTYSYRGSDALPPGEHSGYHNVVDSQGNVWVATYRGSGGIIGVDIKTNEVKWVPVPGLKARRGKIDHKTDRYWFAEYLNDKISVYDIRADEVKRWDLGDYYTPYTASTEDKFGRVYAPSNGAERFIRLDPATDEIVEYQWPTEFDTKKIALDPTTDNVVLWMTNKRTARISKVEPLD